MIVPKARQTSSGKWLIQLRLGGKSVTVTETTEKKCRHAAERVKSEWLANKRIEDIKPDAVKLSDVIDSYLDKRSNIISPSTYRGYAMIGKHRFQNYMAEDVHSIDFAKMVNEEARLCSPKTLKNAFAFVASCVEEATGSRPSASLPQIPKNEHPYLEPEQLPEFLAAVKNTPVEIPALLALCSLRQSELLAVKWADIDLQRGTVSVSGSVVTDIKNKPVYKTTNKNRTSARTVPLMPQLIDALAAAPKHKSTDFVVTLTGNGIYKRVNTICRKLGFPKVGVHGLRHSFASLTYYLQIPPKISMEIGGWKDDQTMQRIYTHISQKHVADKATVIMDFYKNATKIATE